ncbi:cardiomyopathy-associated protein 5 [Sphaeramia orbicularis]|uniref:cardiomyopathy-associated protein 5 n=1 Tax=Sphaeramia orbicularis TaxID=375764 RepID=UPI00117E6093|nr:cardiomyopathy-associated protein 5 [Sphaeramia orbicularis]
MDTEDFTRSDVDAEMTVLSSEDTPVENLNASDEVEDLHNSLREAVHDDNVRPKMQCLMMDSSFSMVTMQGEDSGIKWETTPSRCTTPWEAGNPPADLNSPVTVGPASPVSPPAGKIIFVMDEGLISRQKKAKERTSSQKTKRPQEVFLGSSENISGRPELISFSQPNVKDEEEENEEEVTDPSADKEQRLFRLVSEGSEILNIVVPPKLVSVDEEVSKEMVDNLSYLEESPVTKASEETHDEVFEPEILPPAPTGLRSPSSGPQGMDPPGAPVSRPPPLRGAAGNVDYFEAFSLIDAQAPGSPAVATQGEVKPEAEDNAGIQDAETLGQATGASTTPPSRLSVESEKADTISLEEMTSELLDDVFYGGTDDYMKTSREGDKMGLGALTRVPSKPSGSTLFGSQEDILTPIFLPEGPPKIIDPILLEEPKAMAFLYTDLYEEAIGSRKKEDDTESLTSEKSFHSRHSDREARGYLEKYMLIDETPVVEVEPAKKEQCPEEGPRTLYQDLYDFASVSKPEKHQMPNSEEEVTDFFRSSANSSPCDVEPFPRSLEEDEAQTAPKTKAKTNKNVSINVEKAVENPVDPLGDVSLEEPDWGGTDLDDKDDIVYKGQDLWKQDTEMERPVAPPRKKAPSSPKACLDLTPLTPVDVEEEKEEAGGKEQREEEKETASPPETADEGEGDGEETTKASTNVPLLQDTVAAEEMESPQTEGVEEGNEISAGAIIQSVDEEKDNTMADGKTETTTEQTAAEEIDTVSSEPAKTETQEETVLASEPPKSKGQCIIL